MNQFFRAGVGGVIVNRSGQVLALERTDTAGAWQFPQGGIDGQEEPVAAVWREIEEETGLGPNALQLLRQYPRLLAYELPIQWRTPKVGRGQTQYWFLFRLLADDSAIVLPQPGEFRRWRWLTFPEVIALTAPFRQDLYQQLALDFQPLF